MGWWTLRLPLNCQRCGACCYSDSDTYVPLTEFDQERLGQEAGELEHRDGADCYMKMEDSHCIGLTLRAGTFVCSLYDRRPEICRELERGSASCREEFLLKGEQARQAKARLYS